MFIIRICSGTSIGNFFSKLEDRVNKIAYRVDEADAWFEEKGMMIENLGRNKKVRLYEI